MSQPIRAIYKGGQLRLLEPVNLVEGQEIRVMILSEREQVRAALGDLLVEVPDDAQDIDETSLAQEIETGFKGQSPLSESIIQERREGP
jgi:predicted DNA-binding antitoxin AbrB/MazE fold protein